MRQTMRPVNLGRVVETCYLAERHSPISDQILIENLNVSQRRAREILLETFRMNLLQEDIDGYRISENGKSMLQAIRTNDWRAIHFIMLNYPFYSLYYEAIKKIGPVTIEEIIQYFTESAIHINKAMADVLGDWTERIGSVQRNVFNGRYYAISDEKCSITPDLLTFYDNLNRTVGLSLRQRYVEIPLLRETVCEALRISRDLFDRCLIDLYKRNIGIVELSGAPETTHAKISRKKVKSVVFSEMPDWITMKLTSDQYLLGIQMGQKKYYYLAIHGRDLK